MKIKKEQSKEFLSMKMELSLTPNQMYLARNALSDLGTEDPDCRRIQEAFNNAMGRCFCKK